MRHCHKNFILSFLLSFGLAIPAFAQQEEEEGKPFDMDKAAEREAERLGEILKLEDWQLFYADSILRHDYGAMHEEIQKMQSMGIQNRDLYQDAQDKWLERSEKALRKIFNDTQWKKYLKDGAGRRIKEREKRQKAKK